MNIEQSSTSENQHWSNSIETSDSIQVWLVDSKLVLQETEPA